MDRYARGQFNVGYENRLDVRELRRERVEKAQRARREAGLDALLVWKDENVRYLTDLRPQLIAGKSTVLNGALLVEGEAPILFCSGGERDRVERTMPWITEAHIAPIMEERSLIAGFVKRVVGPVLSDRRLEHCRLGVDEGSMIFFEEIARQLPHVDVVDGDSAMQGCRKIKLPGEIVLLEEATAIADAVTASAARSVLEGVRENDIAAEAMHALYRLGGEYSHVTTPFVASGEHMSPPNRISSDKIVRNGDLVFIDIGAAWSGYYGDVARTTVCGTPSRRQREIYTAVYAGLRAGIAEMRPGRTNVDAAKAIRAAAGQFDLSDRFLSLFMGHGVGIGSNEPPYIGENLPGSLEYEFEPGMVFALEPLIWVDDVRGGGGVRLEEMILITDAEAHVMSRTGFCEDLLID
ncbi:MAG: aminopeptidase P family protein [Actinobacteria bacterium]|nr:aminopeptidase P family protein [Actinomycetota bacterium]